MKKKLLLSLFVAGTPVFLAWRPTTVRDLARFYMTYAPTSFASPDQGLLLGIVVTCFVGIAYLLWIRLCR